MSQGWGNNQGKPGHQGQQQGWGQNNQQQQGWGQQGNQGFSQGNQQGWGNQGQQQGWGHQGQQQQGWGQQGNQGFNHGNQGFNQGNQQGWGNQGQQGNQGFNQGNKQGGIGGGISGFFNPNVDYQIISALDDDLVLDISQGKDSSRSLAILWLINKKKNQVFRFREAGNGRYQIINGMGAALHVPNNSSANGAQLAGGQISNSSAEIF